MPPDIRRSLKKLRPALLKSQQDNRNEADTVQLLVKIFEEILGYDLISEISREAQLKNKFIDVSLKIDGVTKLLVEAKAAAVKLRDRHIDQAKFYAAENNFSWVLLTNSVNWNLYHLTFDEGIEHEVAFAIDLSNEERIDESAGLLAYLHRDAIRRGELEAFWEERSALSAASVGRALFHVRVLRPLRAQIRKDTDLLIDVEDLAKALQTMLSPEAREQIGPVKIRKVKKPKAGLSDAHVPGSVKPTSPTMPSPAGRTLKG